MLIRLSTILLLTLFLASCTKAVDEPQKNKMQQSIAHKQNLDMSQIIDVLIQRPEVMFSNWAQVQKILPEGCNRIKKPFGNNTENVIVDCPVDGVDSLEITFSHNQPKQASIILNFATSVTCQDVFNLVSNRYSTEYGLSTSEEVGGCDAQWRIPQKFHNGIIMLNFSILGLRLSIADESGLTDSERYSELEKASVAQKLNQPAYQLIANLIKKPSLLRQSDKEMLAWLPSSCTALSNDTHEGTSFNCDIEGIAQGRLTGGSDDQVGAITIEFKAPALCEALDIIISEKYGNSVMDGGRCNNAWYTNEPIGVSISKSLGGRFTFSMQDMDNATP